MIATVKKTKRLTVKEFVPKVSEHDIQKSCINWFRLKYPKYLIYAIPNGGQRNKIVAAKLKAEGVLAGIPDLHIPVSKQGFHGLYIEMKAGKNKPSDNQITVMQKLNNEGFRCEVCWTVDQFRLVVDNYFNNYAPGEL
jgi:hypothetical protein